MSFSVMIAFCQNETFTKKFTRTKVLKIDFSKIYYKKTGEKIKENEFVKSLNIIAIKPMLYICNVDEESVQNGNEMSKRVSEYAHKKNHNVVVVSASIESQIAELEDNAEKLEMIKEISKRILDEITRRLHYLENVGLGYLNLNRLSNSLSGGESQRINLATSLGSSLVGSMYILDEPSIGLHPKDTERLIKVLKSLRDLGNTVIVVEHDEDIMKQADHIIDIGPEAGSFGGEVVATGTYKQLLKLDSLTAGYLNHTLKIEVPKKRRTFSNTIEIKGAREHNLQNIDATFPIGLFTAVTGVSGSGKSTLVKKILYPALQKKIGAQANKPGQFSSIEGDFSSINTVEFIDQNPIGRSSRSNPVTYIKAYDEIRALFANLKLSKLRNYR